MSDVVAKLAVMFTADTKGLDDGLSKAKGGIGGLVDGLGKIGLAGMGIGVITGAMGAAAGVAGDLVKSAEALGDSQARVDLVFKDSAKGVTDWAGQNAAAYGLSKQAALDAAGGMGQYLTNLGLGEKASADMSKGSVELAAKLAAFTGKSTDEALSAITKGLGGATKGLKDMGISVADIPKGLDGAAKAQYIYNEILKQSANAQTTWAGNSGDVEVSMQRVSASVENAKAALGEKLLPLIAPLAEAFAGALPGAIDAAMGALDKLQPALDGLTAGLQSALGGIDWAGVSTMIGGAFTAISTAMSGIDWAGIGAAVMAVGSAMMAGIGVVVPVIVSVMQTLWGIIGPFVPLIAGLVAAFALLSNPIGIAIVAITAIGAASQLLGPAWQGVIDALTNLGTAISTNWALFLSTITTALLSIGAAITTSWDAFKQTIADHLAAIAESIRLQWDAFLRVIQDKLTAILGAVTTAWDNVKKAISDTLDGLKAAISDAWSAMQATISGAMDAIKGVVSAALGAVKGIFDAELNAAKALVGVVLDVITGNFSGALDKIVAFVKNGFEGVIALARSILGLLPDAVSKPLSSALDSFANWGRGILDAIARIARDVLDAAGSIGTNIARGISDALTGAWDGLVGKLKALIDLLPQAVKDLLGIHSPSTVFFDIMIDFIEGGVQGLIKGAPRLLQEAGGLARKLTGAFSQVLDPSKLAGMGGSVKTWDLSRMNGKLIKPKAIEELKKLGTRVPNVRGWLWGDKNHGWGDSIPGPHGGFAAKHGVGQGRFSRWAMNAGKDIQFSGQTVVDGGDLKKLGGGDPVAAAVQSLAKALGDLGQVIAKLPPEIGTAVSEAWIKLGQVGGNVGGSGQVGPTVPLPPGTPVPGPVNPPGKNGEGATYIYNQYGNNVVMPKSDDPKGLINALVAHGWGTA